MLAGKVGENLQVGAVWPGERAARSGRRYAGIMASLRSSLRPCMSNTSDPAICPSLPPPAAIAAARQVWLFSGHMVDAPGRTPPRFPADKVALAARAIGEALDDHGAGPQDLAFSQAAAGGDLLFLEACRQRGVRGQVLLPFPEAEFMAGSILKSTDGAAWQARFRAVKAGLQDPPRVMPEVLGPLPEGANPYVRCNEWLLASALACGPEKLSFMALWNGGGGDGPGGTAHMHEEVVRLNGRFVWLDTRQLW